MEALQLAVAERRGRIMEMERMVAELKWRLLTLRDEQSRDEGLLTSEPLPASGVRIVSWGEDEVTVIKIVCEITGLRLKVVKDLVESAPVTIDVSSLTMSAAEVAIRLRNVGATVQELE
jgi:ribosomal protein L7/L12